jgi:hypothetical protein
MRIKPLTNHTGWDLRTEISHPESKGPLGRPRNVLSHILTESLYVANHRLDMHTKVSPKVKGKTLGHFDVDMKIILKWILQTRGREWHTQNLSTEVKSTSAT